MTVCIAAYANNRKNAVLAADTMLTAPAFGNYGVENDSGGKIVQLSDNKYALFAGWTSQCIAIAEAAKQQIEAVPDIATAQCASEVQKQIEIMRAKWLEAGILQPRGFQNLTDYYSKHSSLQASLVSTIDAEINNANNNLFNQNIFFIVAGKDGEVCSLFNIHPANVALPVDGTGYLAIGSGQNIAGYVLLDKGYKPSLTSEDVEKKIRIAKSKSERSVGVGSKIEVVII